MTENEQKVFDKYLKELVLEEELLTITSDDLIKLYAKVTSEDELTTIVNILSKRYVHIKNINQINGNDKLPTIEYEYKPDNNSQVIYMTDYRVDNLFAPSLDEHIDQKMLKSYVHEFLAKIPVKYRNVIELLYGFTTDMPLTEKEVAQHMNMTVDEVISINNQVKEAFKTSDSAKKLELYIPRI